MRDEVTHCSHCWGEHHYYNVDGAFGPNGTSSLYSDRDSLKSALCKVRGITLIVIPYWCVCELYFSWVVTFVGGTVKERVYQARFIEHDQMCFQWAMLVQFRVKIHWIASGTEGNRMQVWIDGSVRLRHILFRLFVELLENSVWMWLVSIRICAYCPFSEHNCIVGIWFRLWWRIWLETRSIWIAIFWTNEILQSRYMASR